jgi:hypothetical protein
LDRDPVSYQRAAIYPSEHESKRKRKGILLVAIRNPSLGVLFGAIYALVAITMLGAVNAGDGGLVEGATEHGFFGFLAAAAGPASVLLMLAIAGALVGYADIKPDPLELRPRIRLGAWIMRFLVGAVHATFHLAIVSLVLWCALHWAPDPPITVWLLGLAAELLIGWALGTTLFGFALWLIHVLRGGRAEHQANDVFAGQALTDYKNFVRMRLDRDGRLTLFPLGVDRVWGQWEYTGEGEDGPRFTPAGDGPTPRLIDGPLTFDP